MSALDLWPLELERTGSHLCFLLSPQGEILPELPAHYEELLAEHLGDLLAEPGRLTVEVNLQSLAGITSRQLGSLIALQKILRRRFGRIPITGVSPAVRQVLTLTHVDQLFDLG
jgi:anti-anti-sigma regulatory factor